MYGRAWTATLVLLSLALTCVPASAGSARPGARLEGLLLAVDGRPASGHTVHLIDERGEEVGRAVSDRQGIYSFRDLEAGRYSLGIQLPGGRIAAVAAPPLRLGGGDLARRDVKLLEAGPETAREAGGANYGFGLWWAGLSPAARAWTIVGMVAVVGITVAALTDDEDERPASPF
jgi:hypothetical protein